MIGIQCHGSLLVVKLVIMLHHLSHMGSLDYKYIIDEGGSIVDRPMGRVHLC